MMLLKELNFVQFVMPQSAQSVKPMILPLFRELLAIYQRSPGGGLRKSQNSKIEQDIVFDIKFSQFKFLYSKNLLIRVEEITMSYYEIVDFSRFTKEDEPFVLKRTPTLEEAILDRSRLCSDGSILKIVKKFEFKWHDKDIIEPIF